jgi:DNA-binding response OmpR family regulator
LWESGDLLDFGARLVQSLGVMDALGDWSPDTPVRRDSPAAQAWPSALRLVVVQSDRELVRQLAALTARLDWELTILPGPPTAEVLLEMNSHAMIVDIRLLGPHWHDWLVRHSARIPRMSVLVSTGPSSVMQRIRGLCAGADDWVTKPCEVEELLARVAAAVRARRVGSGHGAATILRRGDLDVRPDVFDAFVDGRAAGLTPREFAVLLCLAREDNQVLDREHVYREVWGHRMVQGDRALDTAIRKIRFKLERIAPGRRYIHTHRGVGYRFAAGRRISRRA